MNIFSPRQPQEQQQTAHPETAVASEAVQAMVAPIAAERANTVYTARDHVLAQRIVDMPEWQPAIHDPTMVVATQQSRIGHSVMNTAPTPVMAAEQTKESDDLIDPALGYAKADMAAISHDVTDDRRDEAEAQARAAASQAYAAQASPVAEQPAPWQELTDAGMGNPQVPRVVQDVNRLTADLDMDRGNGLDADDIRRQIRDLQG